MDEDGGGGRFKHSQLFSGSADSGDVGVMEDVAQAKLTQRSQLTQSAPFHHQGHFDMNRVFYKLNAGQTTC